MLQSKAGIFFLVQPLLIVLSYGNLHSGSVTLEWNPNSEPDLAGYKLFYGKSSRDYSDIIDTGNTTVYTLTQLENGMTYFFALKAYDRSRNESGFSEEISYTVEEGTNDDLSLITPNGGEKIQVGSRFVVEWDADPNIERLLIYLSTDGGDNWTKINGGTQNDGSWRWNVPDEYKSDRCLMRVEKAKESSINDVSDSFFSIVEGPVVVDNEGGNGLPKALTLNQNYPNPFNPMTTISFNIPAKEADAGPQLVTLTVYDARGRIVRKLVEREMTPGKYSVVWDGRTEMGEVSPSGIYLYAIVVDEETLPPRKMVLAR